MRARAAPHVSFQKQMKLPLEEKSSVHPNHCFGEIDSDPEAKVSARDTWGLFLGWDSIKVGVDLLYVAMKEDDDKSFLLILCGLLVAPFLFQIILYLESGFIQPARVHPDLNRTVCGFTSQSRKIIWSFKATRYMPFIEHL